MKLAKRLRTAALHLLLGTVMILGLCPAVTTATESIDLTQAVGLNITYRASNGEKLTPLGGAIFHLYQVATTDELGNLTATEPFHDYFVDIRGKDDEAWRAHAATLEGYVLRDKIPSTDSGKTDKEGLLSFPTTETKLSPGLYLLLGDRHKQGTSRYDATPTFVLLPTTDKETNSLLYTVSLSPKYSVSTVPGGGGSDTVKRKALKVWRDTGYENKRPAEITVQLLCDGEIYDTVTLNAENNWRYTWEQLSDKYKWTLVEKATAGYTGTVTRDGITFTVTNTYNPPGNPPGNPPDNPPGNPPGGNTPPPSDGYTPPNGDTTPPDTTQPQPEEPNITTLPQTGQLWWPVPIMLCAGLSLIIVGLVRRRVCIGGNGNEK